MHKAFKKHLWMSIGVGVVLLILINAAVRASDLRVDLTLYGRHSVNPGAGRIADQLSAPTRLSYYISKTRSPALAGLEESVAEQLAILSKTGERGMIVFDAAKDIHRVDHDADTMRKLAAQGIRAQTYGGAPLVSSLVLEHPLWPRPKVLELPDAKSLQYDVVSLLARLAHQKVRPSQPAEALRGLDGLWTLSYLYGSADKPEELPIAKLPMRRDVEEVLQWAAQTNSKIRTTSESLATSKIRNLGMGGEPIIETIIGSAGSGFGSLPDSIRYWSTIVVEAPNKRRTTIQGIRDAEGLRERVAQSMWTLSQAQREVGVFIPSTRPEYPATLQRLYTMGNGQPSMPEKRVLELVKQLDFDAREVRITPNEGIPELACLILVRPSSLSLRQIYEIQAWMASGGRVIAFVGNAHVSLMDRGMAMNPSPTSSEDLWPAGDSSGEIRMHAIGGLWKEWLGVNGIDVDEGVVMAPRSSIPFRVYQPKPITPELRYGRPNVQQGIGPLQPFAWPAEGGHALAGNVDALNCRGGGTLTINSQRCGELDLNTEVFLQAPHDAVRLPIDDSGLYYPYADPAALEALMAKTSAVPAGSPMGVLVQGSFPFDPSKTPPPFEGNDGKKWPAPGDTFRKAEGVLAVVAAPDLFEGIDEAGVAELRATLVGGGDGLAQTSSRRLLANLLDAFILGEDLIEVRRSLLPAARRVIPWTERERRMWTVFVIGASPFICALLGLFVLGRRTSRRKESLRDVNPQ